MYCLLDVRAVVDSPYDNQTSSFPSTIHLTIIYSRRPGLKRRETESRDCQTSKEVHEGTRSCNAELYDELRLNIYLTRK